MQAARAAALRDSRRPPPDSFSFTETVQWDAKTFQLPKKLQAKASAPDKNQFLTATLNGVRAANVATNNASSLSLHPLLTTDILRSPNNTLQTLQSISGSPPVLGILKKQGQSVSATLDTTEFRNLFTTFHDECRYKIFVVLLRKEYLGSVLLTAGNLQLQLQKVQQVAFDPVTKSFVYQSVDTFYQKFEAVLTMFGFNKPFPIDVPNAFFSNAAPSLRKQADAMDFEFPPPLNI